MSDKVVKLKFFSLQPHNFSFRVSRIPESESTTPTPANTPKTKPIRKLQGRASSENPSSGRSMIPAAPKMAKTEPRPSFFADVI